MIVDARITDRPIDADALVEQAMDGAITPTSGAQVVFRGVVRNHDGGQAVARLEYSAHPQAQQFLDRAVRDALESYRSQEDEGGCALPSSGESSPAKTPRHGIDRVIVRHRIGKLEIGDAALVVIVESGHRAEAFGACADIVDEIKAAVPIWKHQHYGDGSAQWSNLP